MEPHFMDDWNKRIEDKLDKVMDHVGRQDVTLARLTVSVEEHVKRSNIQEEEHKLLRKEVEPIKKHVAMVNGAIKFIGLLGVLAAIFEAAALWLKH